MKSLVSHTVMIKNEVADDIRSWAFSDLKSVDQELDTLRHHMTAGGKRRVETLTVIGEEDPPLVGIELRNRLRDMLIEKRFDIFHFSGHSITRDGHGGTYLILPGRPGQALAVKITSVAQWLNEGGCHLMVLSSCEGASVLTAMETMKGEAEGVIGFRWKVDDSLCAEYFGRFYQSYFWHGRSFSESFRDACDEVLSNADLLPTWVSAVAVLRD